ncbi:hypothetical protein [Pseudactinotalea sp. HY158]|uniref:hypothetical protein n=1 Tax=Pseudactinotalea sp. HY158 TaxID=2654547 RepID=UPI00129CAB81|nr:hypothetical protein [Pseudactinotalea sp. HY158]QGH68693.1 hypothetical protein GCE65_03655 [Pseudactinotalea sp. HY158]
MFVDWHGVLSPDPFWFSILENERHPYRSAVLSIRSRIFADHRLLESWMRGDISSAEVVRPERLEEFLDRRAKSDYLVRRLAEDCRKFRLDGGLMSYLSSVRNSAELVIATDNMDVAATSIWFRKDISEMFSDLISSSDVGVLKGESPTEFFGPWLYAHGLDFTSAALIDDNAANCAAFESAGGVSIHWTGGVSQLETLQRWFGGDDR